MCNGAKKYLADCLKPLLEKYNFLISSTKDFTTKFKVQKEKFDRNIHNLVSFDIVSSYTMVNTKRAIEIILDRIFKKKTREFFTDVHNYGCFLPFPSRKGFGLFLQGLLTKFNIYHSQVGIWLVAILG